MGAELDVSSLFNVKSVLAKPIATVGIALLLFGFYALLFGQLLHFLWTRPNVINRRLHIIWITCLFVMATTTSFVSLASSIEDAVVYFRALQTQDLDPFFTYLGPSQAKAGITGAINIGYVVTNCIADSVLIYRLYAICGSRRRAVAFPIVASVVTNAFGLATAIMKVLSIKINTLEFVMKTVNYYLGYYAANAAVNGMLTLMIAGRIWWAARDARRGTSSHSSISKEFKTVIAMVLESGIVYPTVLIINVALIGNGSQLDIIVDLGPAVTLVAGIAPTFVILWPYITGYVQEGQLENKSVSFHLESTQVKETNEDKS
ncbi:hypothetical protein Moror_1635 [Moniliophthora roreri MCA 2997]|uniref:Uncharacterized protein n=1 Tax=Moniliophthora roreri (strain MCA 2997) TaxID=1381753 RepID=V2XII2_MONRO|nr:hypothetical protein Moror_1635 [Moniliophthora roreri MCA 2997]